MTECWGRRAGTEDAEDRNAAKAKSENPTLRRRRGGSSTRKGEKQSEKQVPHQRSPKAGDRVRDDNELG